MPFVFFNLPRELRNLVYDNLKEQKSYPPNGTDLYDDEGDERVEPYSQNHDVKLDILPTHILLVSRKFKNEAESQALKTITLSIIDQSTAGYAELSDAVPLQTVGYLEYKTMLLCFDSQDTHPELAQHTQLIKSFLPRLDRLKRINIELYIQKVHLREASAFHPQCQWFMQRMQKLIDIPHVSSVVVRKLVGRQLDVEGGHEIWVRWDAQNGWRSSDCAQANDLGKAE